MNCIDINNWIVDIINWIGDITKWISDIMKWIRDISNSFLDITKSEYMLQRLAILWPYARVNFGARYYVKQLRLHVCGLTTGPRGGWTLICKLTYRYKKKDSATRWGDELHRSYQGSWIQGQRPPPSFRDDKVEGILHEFVLPRLINPW